MTDILLNTICVNKVSCNKSSGFQEKNYTPKLALSALPATSATTPISKAPRGPEDETGGLPWD